MGLPTKRVMAMMPERSLLVPPGGEQSSKGVGGVLGWEDEGNPLPHPTGLGGVMGIRRERPLPCPLLPGLGEVVGGVAVRERPLPLLTDQGSEGGERPLLFPLQADKSPGLNSPRAWA